MPAQDSAGKYAQDKYWHIYNKTKATDTNTIFKDDEDCRLFIGYLDEYLTPPPDPDEIKKEFTINGRTYQGTPHQVKNYHNKIELLAYGLSPLGFHLLINEKESGALKKFMRSITTRYSMNFNKKYNRSGSLFNGPYKSDKIDNINDLIKLSIKIHNSSQRSSFSDYEGVTNTPWINTQTILSLTTQEDYKKSVNNYSAPLERMSLERNNLSSELTSNISDYSEPIAKISEIAFLGVMFLTLFSIGLRNVMAANTQDNTNFIAEVSSPAPTTQPITINTTPTQKEVKTLGVKDKQPLIIQKIMITENKTTWINIRKLPQNDAEIISKTQYGDTYEYTSLKSGWYEILLPNGQTGYVSAEFAKELNNE